VTDDLFTHTLMTLLQDLFTVTVNNGFLNISKCAQRRWLASAISKNQKLSALSGSASKSTDPPT
jgi:hypothetical protein